MKVTIIGWYGTETIGDRAILAGIFSFFSKISPIVDFYLGSLYPFFTERTIKEDCHFWEKITGKNVNITLFNSKRRRELVSYIKLSNLVVMGGGPLMDVDELYLIEYAFKKSKHLGKKTALLGCGIGPLFKFEYKMRLIEIIKNSDLIILRDSQSKVNLLSIFNEFNEYIDVDKIFFSFDPAVECCIKFNHFYEKKQNEYIAVNLRSFPKEYSSAYLNFDDINRKLEKFIFDLSKKFSIRQIRLIPMHYFHLGDDDRDFLNIIRLKSGLKNIVVQNENLSLEKTLETFCDAHITIGMRYHSVVFQTFCHGNNYILDYSGEKTGKISNFLCDIDKNQFYKNRKISLQREIIDIENIIFSNNYFEFDELKIQESLSVYTKSLLLLTNPTKCH